MKKYKFVAKEILLKLESGIYQDKLPTEKNLSKEYQVSISTIRNALALLKKNGSIISKQGAGYYYNYLDNVNEYDSLKINSLSNKYSDQKVHSITKHFELKKASEEEADLLGIDTNDAIYSFKRIRFLNDVAYAIENTLLPLSLFPEFTEEILNGSIFKYIEETTNLKIEYSLKEINSIIISDDDAFLLGIEKNRPVFVVSNKGYLENGRQFEFSRTVHANKSFKILAKADLN